MNHNAKNAMGKKVTNMGFALLKGKGFTLMNILYPVCKTCGKEFGNMYSLPWDNTCECSEPVRMKGESHKPFYVDDEGEFNPNDLY